MLSEDLPNSLPAPRCDDRRLRTIWATFFHFPSVVAAHQLGIFTFLGQGPASANEIAAALVLSLRGTNALLSHLTALELTTKDEDRFSLTQVSREYLLPDSPFYWGGILHASRMELTSKQIIRTVRLDEPPDSALYYLWQGDDNLQIEQAAAITDAMHSMAFPLAVELAERIDMGNMRRMLDVGGGAGSYCIALAQRHPKTQFTVLDLPPVCRIAERHIAAYRLTDRIDTHGLNMFSDPWPTDYDVVFFGNVFHNWPAHKCRALAQHAYEVLPHGGSVHIHEMLVNSQGDGPINVTASGIGMLLSTTGRQYAEAELVQILQAAGFKAIQTRPTMVDYHLVSATKP